MSTTTTPWRVTVVPPRRGSGETSLYLRARRMLNGVAQESRMTTGTLDPVDAERQRAEHEADLNAGARTLPAIMDARILDLEQQVARGTKSANSVDGFRLARARMAEVLDVGVIERPALLRARDQLGALGLGPSTINTYLSRAAACWRWAEERSMVSTSWPRIRALKKPPLAKRPYTPSEVRDLLAWVGAHRGGRWLPLLSLVDETGRRVSEVCLLRGRDVDRAERTVCVRQKGDRVLVLPVSDEVLAMLPVRKPDEWMFPRPLKGGGVGPARRDVVRGVVRRAIVALKIPDGARLDAHSLRRSFATDADRAKVSDEVTMSLSGHESRSMLGHYRKGAVGSDAREGLDRVRAYRATARAGLPGTSPASQPCSTTDEEETGLDHGQRGTRTPDPILVRTPTATKQGEQPQGPRGPRAPEDRNASRQTVRHPSLDERDPRIVVCSRWAAECPAAMELLRDDPDLLGQIVDGIRATAAVPVEAPAKKRAKRSS